MKCCRYTRRSAVTFFEWAALNFAQISFVSFVRARVQERAFQKLAPELAPDTKGSVDYRRDHCCALLS
jgi:hypothetical protein